MKQRALLLTLFAVPLSAAPPNSPGAGTPIRTPEPLPPGLYLPVTLTRTLRAGRTPINSPVPLRTTQRVPLGHGHYLPANTTVLATIITSATTPATLALRPTGLTLHGQIVPLSAAILAAATFVAVAETGIPANGSTDRGNPDPASWTTAQVGGEQVMRSGWYGPLVNATTQTVGSADPWGVYALASSPALPPRALGPFSASARGLFGYNSVCQLDPPTSATTRLTCSVGALILHRGDALLLQTLP